MTPYTRRKFVQHAGAGLLTYCVSGCEQELTPGEARSQGVTLRVISEAESKTIDTVGEVLVPGSAAAGLSHYIDHQLGATPSEQLLMIKYLGVPAPYVDFYRAGLNAISTVADSRYGKPPFELDDNEIGELVADMARGEVDGWQGPPAGFFYFVLRADAVDVVFGTQEGFAELNVPYMAHIEPPSRWGE